MRIQAEISLYPLREKDLTPPIHRFVERLERRGLTVETGPLSSMVVGESAEVFAALAEAFEVSAAEGKRALIVKIIGGE